MMGGDYLELVVIPLAQKAYGRVQAGANYASQRPVQTGLNPNSSVQSDNYQIGRLQNRRFVREKRGEAPEGRSDSI
jgi:hypothetical protein